jgi:UDP-galactopyranose mutase
MQAYVVAVSPLQPAMTLANRRTYPDETLISTMSLPQLIAAVGHEHPRQVKPRQTVHDMCQYDALF